MVHVTIIVLCLRGALSCPSHQAAASLPVLVVKHCEPRIITKQQHSLNAFKVWQLVGSNLKNLLKSDSLFKVVLTVRVINF